MALLRPGTLLDRFEVLRTLGESGLARAFLVRRRSDGALHLLQLTSVKDGAFRERFLDAGEALSTRPVAGAPKVTDVVLLQHEVGLVTEIGAVSALAPWLDDGGAVAASEVGRRFEELCARAAAPAVDRGPAPDPGARREGVAALARDPVRDAPRDPARVLRTRTLFENTEPRPADGRLPTPLGPSPTCVPELTNPRPAPEGEGARLRVRALPAFEAHATEIKDGRGRGLPPYRRREAAPAASAPSPREAPLAGAPPAGAPPAGAQRDAGVTTAGIPAGPVPPPAALDRAAPTALRRAPAPWVSQLAAAALAVALALVGAGAWVRLCATEMAQSSQSLREQAPDLEPLLGYASQDLRRVWSTLRASPEGDALVQAYLASRSPDGRLVSGRTLHAAVRAAVAREVTAAADVASEATARAMLREIDAADGALDRFEATLTDARHAWSTNAARVALTVGWVDPAAAPSRLQLPPLDAPSVALARPAEGRVRR